MTTTKYTFGSDSPYELNVRGKSTSHRRKQSSSSENGEYDADPTDGSGSLTYSAASSINSAGESTDSSFDIMRVLDGQDVDPKELALFRKRDPRYSKDEKSVAESLAYSTDCESNMMRSMATDGESALQGTELLSTITGQASDQFAYDGGNYSGLGERHDPESITPQDSEDILFSPAEHEDSVKRRKERKKRERLNRNLESNATPRVKNGSQKTIGAPATTTSAVPTAAAAAAAASAAPRESRQGTPPTSRPPKANEKVELTEEEDVWYAKWWMFCFPESVKNMSPKR